MLMLERIEITYTCSIMSIPIKYCTCWFKKSVLMLIDRVEENNIINFKNNKTDISE